MATVIIPYYKREKTIVNALKSCVYIKSLDSIIIVDDELSIDSEKFLYNLKSKNKLIKIIKNTQTGAYFARYEGFKKTKSKIILFLDSDDQFLPDIQKMIDKHKNSLEPKLVCSSYFVDKVKVLHKKNINAKDIILNKLCASPFSAIALFNVNELPILNLKLSAYQDDDFCLRISQYNIKTCLENIITSRLNTQNSFNRISNSIVKKHNSFSIFIKYPISLAIKKRNYFLFLKFKILELFNQLLLMVYVKKIKVIYLLLKKSLNKFCFYFLIGVEPL